jgi:hypothetical protein
METLLSDLRISDSNLYRLMHRDFRTHHNSKP